MSSKLLYAAAKETLVEYLNKTSLSGCYLLYYIRRRKYQRLFWFMFIFFQVIFATYVCTTILVTFLQDPTITTLDTQKYTVFEAPFPAVAVCSNNKFSRQAIRKLALQIISNRSANESLEYWENRLGMLSGIYNYDSVDFEEANELQFELESVLGETFKTSKMINILSPLCEDLIVKCFWAGQVINCREEFELKMFIDGPCCVFNYQYMKNPEQLWYPNSTGSQMGLTVLLNTSTDDYFYAEDSAIGFHVKLFSTQRMPDTTMGDMEETHVGVGEDVSIQLDLVSQVTSENTRIYSVQKRGCYFRYEHEKATVDKSECLLICKILLTAFRCDCLPFYAFESDNDGAVVKEECSLRSLGCIDYFKNELIDYSKCSDCYPLCTYSHYYFRKLVNDLKHTFRRHGNEIFLKKFSINPEDFSLVKVYYPAETATRYWKNEIYNWYHILSTIGGVIGLCMGCSLVNGIEIIYFGCFRLLERFFSLKHQ